MSLMSSWTDKAHTEDFSWDKFQLILHCSKICFTIVFKNLLELTEISWDTDPENLELREEHEAKVYEQRR